MSQDPLPEVVERLSKLPKWQIKRLHGMELIANLRALKKLEEELQSKIDWVNRWALLLEDEVGVRATAMKEVERLRKRDEARVEHVRQRNEALERKHLSNQYAE